MAKICIFYFSGTGNSQWVSIQLAKNLLQKGCEVSCFSIEEISFIEASKQSMQSKQLVLGFPVYGSTAPRPMLDFIRALPPVAKKTLAVFATQALGSGDAAHFIGRMLVEKGYTLTQTRHFVMMNNLNLPSFRFIKADNGERLNRVLQKATPKIAHFADDIVSQRKRIIGNNPFGHLLGSFQRLFVDKLIEKGAAKLSVENVKCNRCGYCERICPTRNIQNKESIVVFGSDCIFCLRCYNQCPKDAILVGNGSEDTVKYPRYKGPQGVHFPRGEQSTPD